MIEWIITGILTLIISEILFLMFGDKDNWFTIKFGCLIAGFFCSVTFFRIPYEIAYDCSSILNIGCTSHGIQVFYWVYGIIAAIIIFFYLNKKLINCKTKKKK